VFQANGIPSRLSPPLYNVTPTVDWTEKSPKPLPNAALDNPLVTVTPRLEEELRYDQFFERGNQFRK
jgi:hypothetical protein